MNISRSNVSRSARHVKSVAAVLAVALLATSSWLVVRADVPQVASGTWAPAGRCRSDSQRRRLGRAAGRAYARGGRHRRRCASNGTRRTIQRPAPGRPAAISSSRAPGMPQRS